jgi:hypothetical protein
MAHNNEHKGGCMAKTIEERLALVEKQAEINRLAINAIIERDDTIIRQIAAALGQLKPGTVAKIESAWLFCFQERTCTS